MAGPARQFGLIMPKKAQLSTPKAVNVFGDESDLDEDEGVDWVQKSLKAEGEKNRIKKQARINADRALAEDPTIFQYDEIYSEIHVDIEKKKEEKKKQEPKYIVKLLQNAEKRKRENELRIERIVQKEREAEGDMYQDKEKFVTASYRKKLEENKKLEEEEKERERLEAIGDVTKQVNIDGFYRHFFNQTFETGPKKDEAKKLDESVKSSEKNLDADDNTVNDSDSNDEKNKKKALQIISKNRKGKQYRKRVTEVVESESEEENKEEMEKQKDKDEDKETGEEIESKKIEAEATKIEECSTSGDKQKDKEEKTVGESKDNEKLANNSDKQRKEGEKPKPRRSERNVEIWVKRTVGPVFEAALQRYYARQAVKTSS